MRKAKSKLMTLRLDEYVYHYLEKLEGSNDAEKVRYLIRFGIVYDRRLRKNLLPLENHMLSQEISNEA